MADEVVQVMAREASRLTSGIRRFDPSMQLLPPGATMGTR